MSIYDNKVKMRAEREAQNKLRDKYEVEEETPVIIKETSNMTKFFIRTAGTVIRILASVVIAVLSATGILALAYPQIRAEVFSVLSDAIWSVI